MKTRTEGRSPEALLLVVVPPSFEMFFSLPPPMSVLPSCKLNKCIDVIWWLLFSTMFKHFVILNPIITLALLYYISLCVMILLIHEVLFIVIHLIMWIFLPLVHGLCLLVSRISFFLLHTLYLFYG